MDYDFLSGKKSIDFAVDYNFLLRKKSIDFAVDYDEFSDFYFWAFNIEETIITVNKNLYFVGFRKSPFISKQKPNQRE